MSDLSVENIERAVCAQYQPIVDLADDRFVGCEALARWRNEDGVLGSIEPHADVIEGDEVLATALTTRMLRCVNRDLLDLLVRRPAFYVSINLPPIILGQGQLRPVFENLGIAYRMPQLVGEITERRALDDTGRAAIREIRDMGSRIALDDFGTGKANLQELIGLEVDILKIDRSFVIKLGEDRLAERLVRGIAALAGVLRVDMVAEGVETREQALFLRAIGVEKGQGWLWSKALDAADLIAAVG
ncbi:MAG: EAL domain-containing protein [Defluviicoccus sp.]|nr:MAG: EAL domain-containing protein [Defluviicoccus sp.]